MTEFWEERKYDWKIILANVTLIKLKHKLWQKIMTKHGRYFLKRKKIEPDE